jgi:arabinofuranosyltransferase
MNNSSDNLFNGRFSWFSLCSLVILLFAVSVYFGGTYYNHLERWDDAYITFRFAKHFADGQGLIWNIGGEPVEGFTSFLHVIFLALGIKLGIDPWIGSLIISVISVLTTAAIMLAVVWRQFGTIHPVVAVFIGIYLIDAVTAIHTTSGLETQFFVAVICGCYFFAFLFIENRSWQSAIGLGALTFLSCLTRPEAVIYGAGLYFALFVYCLSPSQNDENGKAKFVKLFASSAVVVLLGLSYAAWKYNYYGYILPNPYYVKSNKFSLAGLSEVTDYLKHLIKWFAPLLFAGILLVFTDKLREVSALSKLKKAANEFRLLLGNSQTRAKILITLTPPLLALSYYSTIIHEVGGAFRFSYPTYFYFVLSFGIFFYLLTRSVKFSKITQLGLIASAVIWFGLLFISQKSWRISPIPTSAFNQFHTKIGEALKSTGLGAEGTILCDAAGIIPYISGFNQVDRVGLVDNFLSGRKPATPSERETYIWSRPIDVYVGFEPPAQAGAQSPENDSQMKTEYVSEILLKRKLTLVESRVFIQDPQMLHQRMRELRDNWYLLGETQSPMWKAWKLKSFIYVRRNSPNAQLLISKLKSIIELEPSQINLNDIGKQ